jgi:ceramide glucosyltransferase
MAMLFIVFATLSLAGLGLLVLAVWTVRSPRWCEPARETGFAPPVSILKPLKGVDGHLARNLESFCELDYPEYEIIFAASDPLDPALEVARMMRQRHPQRPITVLAGEMGEALNQKVATLLPALARARHSFILISDSNVLVEPDYLRETAGHAADPRVGLVTNLIRGMGGRELGARLENLHLNSFVMASVAFLDRFLRLPLAVGKSMLIRREALESIGGLAAFADILAEDYMMGRNLHRAGWRIALCHHKVTNVNSGWSLASFLSRHARWARLRRQIGPLTYLTEPLANPFFLALLALPFSWAGPGPGWGIALAGGSAAMVTALNALMGRLAGSDLEPLDYLLSPLKDLLAALVWLVPFFSNRVEWRGVAYRVGRGSRLVPIGRP